MDTNLYRCLRGNYEQRKQKLATQPKEFLEAAILDSEYNEFLRSRADYPENTKPVDPTIANGQANGKRLPYIGWFWRHVEFSSGTIPIGDSEGIMVGIMPRNKWDYVERNLTPEEFAAVMTIIDEAMRLNEEGGNLATINTNTNRELEKLWPLFQTFKV